MAYMNPLETEKEITAYKEWLSNKPYHFLKCLKATFNMHLKMETNKYPNLSLRMELLDEEIKKKY